ncbi:MAG: sodium-dependent transporter [Gammaproteobacteria bacterium]
MPLQKSNNQAVSYPHEYWSSRLGFVLAATGSAVGLGNIWKFPYIAGEHGGGAFVLLYLLCVAVIGIPVMMAETLIGRRGGQSPIHSYVLLARQEGRSRGWQAAGWSAVVASLLILSFYSVIGGWAIAYVLYAARGIFHGVQAHGVDKLFTDLLARPGELLAWHTVFMLLTVLVVARGVRGGLERAVTLLMPLLFVLLLLLVAYAALSTEQFLPAAAFLFQPDVSKLSAAAVLAAMGQAFFSLSLGAGILIAYGSYLPKDVSIARTATAICIADTAVALLAGLAIFPEVFASGLEASAGPGLIFQTLPIAFGRMPGGTLFGTLFFVLLVVAAWTSSISLLEPAVEWMLEHRGIGRQTSAWMVGALVWAVGIVSVLSFNLWSDVLLFGRSVFESLDYLASNIMLPLNGLLSAIFAGWIMAKVATEEELAMGTGIGYSHWRLAVRYIAPAGVATVLLSSSGAIALLSR